jgi:hypothetical protein
VPQDHGSVEPYADCSPLPSEFNEIVADGRRNVYVNEVGFDFLKFIAEPSDAPRTERPGYQPGFIGQITPDGMAQQVADGVSFLNGMSSRPTTRRSSCPSRLAGGLLRSTSAPTAGCPTGGCSPTGSAPTGSASTRMGRCGHRTAAPTAYGSAKVER